MPLTDLDFHLEYSPESCDDFVAEFYDPALAQAVRYDRTTYTFSAAGLHTAARGTAGLIRNGGRIRLICDHRITPETYEAIRAGRQQAAEILRRNVAPSDLTAITPDDIAGKQALELLTWLVSKNRLDLRVAIVPDDAIFHDKHGVIADAQGNYIVFHGSLNETRAGAQENYESFDVYTSWQQSDQRRAASKATRFETLWHGESKRAIVIPLPDEYQTHLQEYAARNRPAAPAEVDQRAAYWQRIQDALSNDPATTFATVPAELWPHQIAFFNRHAYSSRPNRILIADEVGLGKTIQAGILLKCHINQSRANRVLILAPKPACRQWQDELQSKFNIGIPMLETGVRLTLAHPDGSIADAPNPPWSADRLIASYQWLRYKQKEFLADNPRYDMVIVDEAHRARFSEVASENRRPNRYLQLLRQLARRTGSLLLLTATPMQMHEAELHALLELLAPTGWTSQQFRRFYDDQNPPNADQWRLMAELYRPHSPCPEARDERLIHNRNDSYVTSRLNEETIGRTTKLMRERSPARRLMSRHTRETLRQYAREGRIQAVVPERKVHPVAISMNDAERRLYDEIDTLVSEVYAGAPGVNATALGFIMTTYRKRLGSSPRAFAQTCRNHLERQEADAAAWREIARRNDEEPDEELDDAPDTPLPGTTLTIKSKDLLNQAAQNAGNLELRDTKFAELRRHLDHLNQAGHRKIIIFTQFRDTMLYLSHRLAQHGHPNIVHISGQDGPELGSRTQRIKRLREADDGLLICTETASESLNLQFCSAMVNYDIPWNPMTLEQRIGRIDRIGQELQSVDIINLFYAGTAEWDAYEAMLERLRSIHDNVGQYQPILYDPASASRIAAIIRDNQGRDATRTAVNNLDTATRLNLDLLNSELETIQEPAPTITMQDITRALTEPGLLPDGWSAEGRGGLHWQITKPDGGSRLVTSNRHTYEHHGEDVEWFGPGSPWWPEQVKGIT